MNPFAVSFDELYQRHLCRHSQFGINVQHLTGVAVTYFMLFGIIAWACGPWGGWALMALTVPYLAVLATNVPPPVFAAVLAFMIAVFAAFLPPPHMPVWLCALVIVVSYKIQACAHRFFTEERDMTEFNKKYRKGPALFLLLSVYELPILLKYLVVDWKNWAHVRPGGVPDPGDAWPLRP